MSMFRRDASRNASPGCSPVGAPVSMIIIAINCLLFLFNNIMGNPAADGNFPETRLATFTFSPGMGHVYPGIITHMFSHANAGHLIGNMIMLLFLGTQVERAYRPLRYLILYLVSGLAAAAAQAISTPDAVMLGASGAIAGVMAAFARHWPHQMLYFAGRVPMPAWLYMLIWVGYNVLGSQSNAPGVAFMAHLGGFAAGLILSFIIAPRIEREAG